MRAKALEDRPLRLRHAGRGPADARPLHAAHRAQRSRTSNFINNLAYCFTSCAVAREVVEAAPDKTMEHPVGTGPYVLSEWRRSSRIVLTANPGYRERYYEARAGRRRRDRAGHLRAVEGPPPADDAARRDQHHRADAAALAVVPERRGRLDRAACPRSSRTSRSRTASSRRTSPSAGSSSNAIRASRSRSRTSRWRTRSSAATRPRRSRCGARSASATTSDEEIRVLRRNQAIPAQSPIGPGADGYDPNFRSIGPEYDPAKARALLDLLRLRRPRRRRLSRDARRQAARHRPLVAAHAGLQGDGRAVEEGHGRDRHPDDVSKQQFPELLKQSKAGQLMMWGLAWSATSPDRRDVPTRRCTAAASGRPTTRASTCPNTTRSSSNRASCPTGPSATRSTGA